jgi:hypothetical protein
LAAVLKKRTKKKKRGVWRCGESNPVPLACEASALPYELHPRFGYQVTYYIMNKKSILFGFLTDKFEFVKRGRVGTSFIIILFGFLVAINYNASCSFKITNSLS